MKKIFIAVTTLLLSFIVFVDISYAAEQTRSALVPTNKIIPNLPTALADLKKKTKIPVIFSKAVPQDAEVKQYYANIDLPQKPVAYDYIINIDATPDCNGIHVCNLGYLRAKKGGKPEKFQDRDNKNITVPVTLTNKVKAYFTPGHAMGSFFPALIEWQQNGILYSLSWKLAPEQEKSTLIEMAKSAILNR